MISDDEDEAYVERELELEQRCCERDGLGGHGGHERPGVHAVYVHQRRCQRLERPM